MNFILMTLLISSSVWALGDTSILPNEPEALSHSVEPVKEIEKIKSQKQEESTKEKRPRSKQDRSGEEKEE